MSRTNRKPKFLIKETEKSYVNRMIRWYMRNQVGSKRIRKKKSNEQYSAELSVQKELNLKEYYEKLKTASIDENGKPYIGFIWVTDYCNRGFEHQYNLGKYVKNYLYLKPAYVQKYYYVKQEINLDDEISEAKKEYATFTRDGKWNETGRNTGFKEASKLKIRRENKRLCNKIIKDEEYDHVSYPDRYIGKPSIWDFW